MMVTDQKDGDDDGDDAAAIIMHGMACMFLFFFVLFQFAGMVVDNCNEGKVRRCCKLTQNKQYCCY